MKNLEDILGSEVSFILIEVFGEGMCEGSGVNIE